MINIVDKKKCSGCHACASICPKKCISMVYDREGFLYPTVDSESCISCSLCEMACPIITPKKTEKNGKDISAFGAYVKNEEILLKSTSGGIFTEIASCVINNGGVVFGAAFNEDFSVSHKMVDNVEDLSIFRGSKYVQSTIGDAYMEAKKQLDDGRLVLFTGTPCQIGGIYSFLNKDYENLITQDVVCHGVPSPMVWQKYKFYQENKFLSKTKDVQFRCKIPGSEGSYVVFNFENNDRYVKKGTDDLYMKSFVSNLCLRPSCFECNFKGKVRQSDITLADFWGVERVMPEMKSKKGISLVLVNSNKGSELFNKIQEKIEFKKASLDEALKYNASVVNSPNEPQAREDFIKITCADGFEASSKKYLKESFKAKFKKTVKRILKKLRLYK